VQRDPDAGPLEFVIDVTEMVFFHGYGSAVTWDKIEKIVSRYHQRAVAEYERVGFLVTVDHGLFRVPRALHKKSSDESEFYCSGRDRRRFRGFVTIGRGQEGVDYEALLLEQGAARRGSGSLGEEEGRRSDGANYYVRRGAASAAGSSCQAKGPMARFLGFSTGKKAPLAAGL
jgi:hypothetical protein